MALRGRSPRGAVGLLLMLLAVSVGLASARRGRRGMGATIKQGPLVAVRWRFNGVGAVQKIVVATLFCQLAVSKTHAAVRARDRGRGH